MGACQGKKDHSSHGSGTAPATGAHPAAHAPVPGARVAVGKPPAKPPQKASVLVANVSNQ